MYAYNVVVPEHACHNEGLDRAGDAGKLRLQTRIRSNTRPGTSTGEILSMISGGGQVRGIVSTTGQDFALSIWGVKVLSKFYNSKFVPQLYYTCIYIIYIYIYIHVYTVVCQCYGSRGYILS